MRIIKLPTCETETFVSRNNTVIDGIICHTTDTNGLKRITIIRNEDDKKYIGSLVKRALDLPGVTKEQYDFLMFEYVQVGSEISDALRLCIQAAGLERKASWHYCVASKKTKFPLNRSDTYPGVVDTDVIEFVPPELQAHHVGALGKPTNRRSIGIENMYPCALSKGKYSENEAISYYENIGWPKPELKKGPDGAKYWYTPIEQDSFRALEDLCVELIEKFPTIYWIGSHFQFCKDRIDPDPPIDLALLRKNVSARMGKVLVDKPTGSPKIKK
jgi:hypothetical protein